MDLTARVHREDDAYWAEVVALPGCFATGDTLDELTEALTESIGLYLQKEGGGSPGGLEVAELRVATTAPVDRT